MSAVMPTYARADLAFERGEGAWLFTDDGRKFLDFCSGVAVTALGHSHPYLVKALTEQAGKLWHCSNLYRVPGQERLAARLVEKSFADLAFFCNSGAEAVECGLKLIRKYQHESGQPNRYRVIAFDQAFHGRTLATIAAGGQAKHLKGFEPMVEGFDRVPFGNLNALRDAITPETAGILVEPVQGEGGLRTADADFLKGLRAAADEFGLLLMYDEVQCGMGRTGKLFAHEWADVAPDVMALAKGLGGGFPVGACLATAKAAKGMTAGTHGSTFGGNPLAMAVANAVLDVMEAPGFFERVEFTAGLLRTRLEALVGRYPKVLSEVRGLGLMLGLKCVAENGNAQLSEALANENMLTVMAGDNVVRLVPSLVIGQPEIEAAIGAIDRACAKLSQG
jgi:acetylornithine/N-succinyldiaminopimelate aminotransferase